MAVPLAHFRALPHYLGGKRQIVNVIFAAASQAGYGPAMGHVFVDAFMGGGSVALTAKALGYRVIANDTAGRSQAVGQGLLENDRTRLDVADIELALEHDVGWLPPVREFPYTDQARDMFGRLAAAAAEHPSPIKAALLRLAVFKAAQRIAPYSQPNAAGSAAMRIRTKDYDALSEYDRGFHVPRFTRPRAFIDQGLDELAAGIFPNGERNRFVRGDALEFIEAIAAPSPAPEAAPKVRRRPRGAPAADVLYLDPPYPGTKVYETHFRALDSLLEGRWIDAEPSRFSAKDGWEHIDALLTAGESFPVWIISLGAASVEMAQIEDMVRGHGREPLVASVKHMHLKGTSSAEHRAANEELVITAAASGPTKEG